MDKPEFVLDDALKLRLVSLQLSRNNGATTDHSISQSWHICESDDEAVGKAIRGIAELKPGFSVDQFLVCTPFAGQEWAAAQSQPTAEPVDVQPAREVPDESVPSFHPGNGPLVTGEYLGRFLRAHGMAIVYREGPRHAE